MGKIVLVGHRVGLFVQEDPGKMCGGGWPGSLRLVRLFVVIRSERSNERRCRSPD